MPTVDCPVQHVLDQGFSPNAKNMAPDYQYSLEVYQLPTRYSNHSKEPTNWKEYGQMQVLKSKFSDFIQNEVISCMNTV